VGGAYTPRLTGLCGRETVGARGFEPLTSSASRMLDALVRGLW
jgi:hypothetical protein